jgi:hypothetical protein
MKPIQILFSLVVLLAFGCGSEEKATVLSKNSFVKYFYPVDTVPKIYLYRDVANGLDEKFHRVYAINDSKGQHVVVEMYTSTGRLTEAYNYNIDSLDLMDHMVVDRNGEKKKTELFKNKLIPMQANEEVWFASRFQGFLDSTLILSEIKRKTDGVEISHNVMGKDVPCVVMTDHVRLSNFNPFTKKDNIIETESINYFAEGYGLVEWHTVNKKAHYKLERIFSQEEWLKIITR